MVCVGEQSEFGSVFKMMKSEEVREGGREGREGREVRG